MVILCIETSTDACSAALTKNGKVLMIDDKPMSRIERQKSEHARQLPLFIEELLTALRETDEHVEAVAVSAGPGSYTGLRIGASTAKGLAYGMGVPLLAIPTLQLMAEAVEVGDKDAVLCPMIDARRMEVYSALYKADGTLLHDAEAVVVDETSYADLRKEKDVYFFGNGSEKTQEVLAGEHSHFVADIVPDAAYMGRLAEQAFEAKRFEDVAYWTPFYLKEFEAKKSVVKGLS